MKTASIPSFMAKTGEVEQNWWLVDADQKVVGRLASDIAVILMGKHRPTYTPHVDTGDYVIVINAEKVAFTGKKWDQKRYTWTTQYPGLKTENARTRFEHRPETILIEAVRRLQDARQAQGLRGRPAPAPGPEFPAQRAGDQGD